MGASIVAGMNAAPVLEATEHDLDLVALAVEPGNVRDGHSPACPGWDPGGDLTVGQGSAEPVGP